MVPSSPPRFGDKESDVKRWGEPSKVCSDCIDESKIQEGMIKRCEGWPDFRPGNNCSDIVRSLILGALPDQQKPKCPCPEGDLYYVLDDLMFPGGGISTPTKLENQLKALSENGCQRYKCELKVRIRGPKW